MDSLEDALAHIARFGTGHTETIVTQSHRAAQRLIAEIDAATVGVNTATETPDKLFSTQKLQVRGPVDPEVLTTTKHIEWANDQDCA